ncbi:Hypothetical predicted protein [Prunus dulcis]|uniref:Bifunctional inhibitor/lipid-transfer protein/seed storage 2S albumin superfamily protein n=1 Tax=Prunus dulcis TaxID=3755 RepID=A0A5E4GC69_PRUDU|nr:Hypothetical predicted protein [Prunus dulcis]
MLITTHLPATIIFFTLQAQVLLFDESAAQATGGQSEKGIDFHLLHCLTLIVRSCEREECLLSDIDICCKELEFLDPPCRCPRLMQMVELQRFFTTRPKWKKCAKEQRTFRLSAT